MDAGDRKALKTSIENTAKTITDPAGRSVSVIEDHRIQELARQFQCHPGEIHAIALENNIWPYRYLRNHELYSREEQLKLAESRVAVVGCGGLGGTVTLLLARSGVGFLTLVDYDVFDETNLNRQALSSIDRIGKGKGEAGRDTVAEINPSVKVRVERKRIDENSASSILADVDVVVDALDNIPDRLILEQAARDLKKPLVHGALAGFNGQVMTIFPEDPGLGLIYNTGAKRKDPQSPEAVLGVPAITPSVVASFQAMEVIKILLGRGQLLRKKFMYFDLESNRYRVMELQPPGE
jgi:molybdopterin/thiamine biosynthesis adenylyltransferase